MFLRTYNWAKNLVRQPAHTVQINTSDNTLWNGSDNNFPLKLATLVQESPSASSCISIISDFIEGDGFSNKNLQDLRVNNYGQRFGDIHSLTSDSLALNEGFAFNIKYNIEGAITEIFSVPFENVRLCKPDDKGIISKCKVNPYFGTSEYRLADSKEYYLYNPDPKVVKAQIEKDGTKYKGQILFVGTTKPLSRYYPVPDYFSAQFWMNVDARIGQFHANNLEDGFFQNVIMKMAGDNNQPSTHPDDQEEDESGNLKSIRTLGERFDIEMQKFQGSDSRNKIFVFWSQMKEQFPELQAFPTTANDQLFTALQNLTTKNITIATKVPAVLANIQEANNFSGEQIRPAVKLMQQRTVKQRALLERTYQDLLTRMVKPVTEPVSIINHNPFPELEKIDDNIWAALRPDEQRAWIKANTTYPIIDQPTAPNAVPGPSTPKALEASNVMFTDYPQGAKENVKRALKWMEDNKGCGTAGGKRMSHDLIDGKPISFKDVKKLYNWLKRNRIHDGKLFSDSCDAVLYSAWGGNEMYEWTAKTIQMING